VLAAGVLKGTVTLGRREGRATGESEAALRGYLVPDHTSGSRKTPRNSGKDPGGAESVARISAETD